MPDPKVHVFVVCPNNSGSTLIAQLLGTSKHATLLSALNHEGQWAARDVSEGLMPFPVDEEKRNWTTHAEKFRNPENYDWSGLKKAWEANWDARLPVRVEKTPSLILSAQLFAERFENSRFLLSIRNPYAFCEGVRRRQGHSLTAAAHHWLAVANAQIENRERLHPQYFFSYESLCANPAETTRGILNLVPELESLNTERVFDVMSLRSEIRDQNPEQIARLSPDEIDKITSVLRQDPIAMQLFDYELLQ